MATKFSTTTAFIDKLLAPLPENVEQVDDKRFNRALRDDAKHMWHMEKLKVEAARCYRDASNYLHIIAQSCAPEAVPEKRRASEDCHEAYLAACDGLMMIPAPNIAALRWKEGCREFCGGCPEWEAQIAKDCLKLGAPFTPRRADRK